jgi:acetoin utilization deacetylase AcuC-like enzyme
MPVTIITTPQHTLHSNAHHPEQAARIAAIMAAINAAPIAGTTMQVAQMADLDCIRAVHTPAYVEWLQRRCERITALSDLTADTYITPDSVTAARQAAGAACDAIDALQAGQPAMALGRPPGHHATPGEAMGFCFFNNIAIAARYAQRQHGMRRIAIIDVDIHHGNGTQDAFYDDADVLFISSHSSPLYPFSGKREQMGQGAGRGTTLNIPLQRLSDDAAYLAAYQQVVIPALTRFQPECLLISAGYDAHWDDPVGNCAVSVTGYGQLMQLLVAAADQLCGGKIAAILEGGYSQRALAASVHATLCQLAKQPMLPDTLGQRTGNPHGADQSIAWLRTHHPLLHDAKEIFS